MKNVDLGSEKLIIRSGKGENPKLEESRKS